MILRAPGGEKNRSAAQCQPVISAVNLPWLRRSSVWLSAVCPLTLGLLGGGVTSCTTLPGRNSWLELTRLEVRGWVEIGPEPLQRSTGGLGCWWLRSFSRGVSCSLTWDTMKDRLHNWCLLCKQQYVFIPVKQHLIKMTRHPLFLFNSATSVCNTVFK